MLPVITAPNKQDTRTEPIIGCAIEVHDALGPGLLEAPYHAAMCIALAERHLKFEREKEYPALFHGVKVGQYRPDLIVNDEVVVEIKSVERFQPVFLAQMLTYLRITGCEVGLIINFNKSRVSEGIKRVILSRS
jgi:GxxExxY protein